MLAPLARPSDFLRHRSGPHTAGPRNLRASAVSTRRLLLPYTQGLDIATSATASGTRELANPKQPQANARRKLFLAPHERAPLAAIQLVRPRARRHGAGCGHSQLDPRPARRHKPAATRKRPQQTHTPPAQATSPGVRSPRPLDNQGPMRTGRPGSREQPVAGRGHDRFPVGEGLGNRDPARPRLRRQEEDQRQAPHRRRHHRQVLAVGTAAARIATRETAAGDPAPRLDRPAGTAAL